MSITVTDARRHHFDCSHNRCLTFDGENACVLSQDRWMHGRANYWWDLCSESRELCSRRAIVHTCARVYLTLLHFFIFSSSRINTGFALARTGIDAARAISPVESQSAWRSTCGGPMAHVWHVTLCKSTTWLSITKLIIKTNPHLN